MNMYMRGYWDAFQRITNLMPTAPADDVIRLYADAAALFHDMRYCGEDIPENERPASYEHTIEKLERWIDTVSRWAMPRQGDTRESRNQLITEARGYLESARTNWPGEDWV
jgi:hypothetical protein